MRSAAAAVASVVTLLCCTVIAQPLTGLQRLLDAELARFPGRAGIWVKHLTSGEEAGVRADEIFNSASVIKIPVMVLAYQMADKGQSPLDQRITIKPQDIRGGSGVFRYHDAGLQPTLRDVLMQMVITSDNTATDLAIANVGGVARVNAWLAENGYADGMRLTQTTGELFAKYNALPQGANRNEKTNADRTYWLGEMTPRATGRMLAALQQCSGGSLAAPAPSPSPRPFSAPPPAPSLGAPLIASQKSCDAMIRVMRAQQAGT
ncbi:MAG: serine hydrolase, partial [Vicinamibacterales bacterium]